MLGFSLHENRTIEPQTATEQRFSARHRVLALSL